MAKKVINQTDRIDYKNLGFPYRTRTRELNPRISYTDYADCNLCGNSVILNKPDRDDRHERCIKCNLTVFVGEKRRSWLYLLWREITDPCG